MVTVFLPTANRPHFLKTSLASVLNQTAGHLIERIIVSENGLNNASKMVCESFHDPRIQYEYLEPQQPHPERLLNLYRQAGSEYTATLHDDDWWFPTFIERAHKCLDGTPSKAYFCEWNYYLSERSCESSPSKNYAFWFASGFPALTSPWTMTAAQVALSCLPGTPNHISAGVWRREVLQHGLQPLVESRNSFDCDRYLTANIARHGGMIFDPQPLVCIRHHQQQDVKRFTTEMRKPFVSGTTRFVMGLCSELNMDLSSELDSLIERCPNDSLLACMRCFQQSVFDDLQERNMIGPKLAEWLAWDKKKRFNKSVARWLPPVITDNL